jgi:hypothetical protein
MRWKPGQNKPIFDFVTKYTDRCFFTYPSMDTFMFHNFGPFSPPSNEAFEHERKNHFQYYDKGIITSERVAETNDKPGIIHMLEGLTSQEKLNYAPT